ncbi:hypothetical protein ASC94_25690 [Massilia sp. Root418]|jgi:hypothetical protein|nr:hypothetical protein ASC94_25690 [Massilia sp. Root418]
MPNIPGAAVMTDTLDFVKNLWGSMGVVPGIAAPTLSVDELDKKINDLRAVEAWLNLNSSMVRGSIQALEVQRNTIATLKSMGKTLADAVQQQQPAAGKEKSLFESIPYASAFFQHAADALAPGAAGAAPADPFKPAAAATAAPTEAPAAKPTAAPMSDAEAAAAAAAPMVNAAAWWNLLQEQFKQAVSTAMTTDAGAGAAAGNPPAKADKGNLPEAEDKAANGKKANGDGNGNGGAEGGGNGGKNGAAAAARKAPIKRASGAKAGKE